MKYCYIAMIMVLIRLFFISINIIGYMHIIVNHINYISTFDNVALRMSFRVAFHT